MTQQPRRQPGFEPPERLPPWWIFAAALCYVSLLALIPYLVIWGPSDILGLRWDFQSGNMLLLEVSEDSAPGQAGIRAGDRVLSIDRRPMQGGKDWLANNANLEVGQVQRWEINRDGQRLVREVTIERADWRNRLAGGYISYSLQVLFSFAVGLFIAFRRPHHTAARIGAWFIGTASIAFGLPNGWAALWRQIPSAIQMLFWVPEISRFVLEAIFLSLLMVFPRRLTRARWPWFLIWAPVLATLPWRVMQFWEIIFNPSESSVVPPWINQLIISRTMLYLAAGITILLIAYRRLLDRAEKRRVRVLLLGTAVSLGSAIAFVWYTSVLGWGFDIGFWILFVHPLTLAAPLAFAYAIVRHRVFDIRVIVRQGLQYAFARGAVLAVVPAMGAFLVADLALNSRQPLADILSERGWIYFVVGAAAVALYWKRDRWLESIDRRFFREHYDAQRLLRDIIQQIRSAQSFEEAALPVSSRIESALHPEFVCLLVREPDEPAFSPLGSSTPDTYSISISAESKLIGLASVLGKPLEILLGDSDWLERRLPLEEIQMVRQAGIDLVIPISTKPGSKQALLVLGIRRSEEPYTEKDQELLEAIAASLALLLEQPSGQGVQPIPAAAAEASQTKTVDISSLDRTLGQLDEPIANSIFSHYRVLQKIGEGGMGKIFLAEDISLNRKVALKFLSGLLKEEQVARKRFLREAKSAAALDHPFICKIYEIGQSETGQIFIAMEYVEGQTLQARLEAGPLPLQESLRIALQINNALETAHKKGVVHRDLKPANIMLTEQGHVKVMDFGLAKRLAGGDSATQDLTSGLTGEGATVGTLAYMSPEQVWARPVDQRSDVFSFGIVLYEMLTGVHPFRRPQAFQTMNAITRENPKPLTDYLSQPTARLQDLLSKMLAKQPEHRYSDAGALTKDLVQLFGVGPR